MSENAASSLNLFTYFLRATSGLFVPHLFIATSYAISGGVRRWLAEKCAQYRREYISLLKHYSLENNGLIV